MQEFIKKRIKESIETKHALLKDADKIERISNIIIDALKKNNKVLICGNGGSAADSQHFAAELVGRFKKNRRGLPAIALTTDTSILTAVANDFGYDLVFQKQVEALGNPGDILIGFSTSGNSKNIIEAVNEAKKMKLRTVAFLGYSGGLLKDMCDEKIIVNSNDTARIQECHITMIHIICELIENKLFSDAK